MYIATFTAILSAHGERERPKDVISSQDVVKIYRQQGDMLQTEELKQLKKKKSKLRNGDIIVEQLVRTTGYV